MNTMMNRLFLFLLSQMLCLQAVGEEIVFEMSVFGIKFGTMVVTRSQPNDTIEIFTLHAKGKTDFLWMQREEESKYKVEYRGGKLYSSDFVYLNKGSMEKWSKVVQEGSGYKISSNEGSKFIGQMTDYSLLKLYFEPSWNRQQVFCEEDCSFAQLTRQDKQLKVVCQDGNRSTYHLKDGQIHKLEIHLAVATVTLNRIK